MHAIVNNITYMIDVNTLWGMCREFALWQNMSHELLDENESTFIKFIQIYLKVDNNAVYHYEVFTSKIKAGSVTITVITAL